MKIIFVLFILGAVNIYHAQHINREEIERKVSDINSSFYYSNLVDDFINKPILLLSNPLKSECLYYGKLYSNYYKNNSETKSDLFKFLRSINSEKYKKAIIRGEELLKKDPVNLAVLLNLINCYKHENTESEKIKKIELQAEIILKTIARYGNGISKDKSFKVISNSDEFALLNYLNINLDQYIRSSIKECSKEILDIWFKNINYKEDRRDTIYFTVYTKEKNKKK